MTLMVESTESMKKDLDMYLEVNCIQRELDENWMFRAGC